MIKQIITMLTISALALYNIPNIASAETTTVSEAGGSVKSKVSLNIQSSSTNDPNPSQPTDTVIFSATVPKVLPVSVNKDTGVITVADNLQIVNNVTTKGIKVTEIEVEPAENWTITDYAEDFTSISENTSTFGMSLRGDNVNTNGSVTLTDEYWSIAKDTSIDIDMKVKLPPITESADNSADIATVGFTLDWSGDDTSTENTNPTPPDNNSNVHDVTFTVEGKGYLKSADGELQSLTLQTDDTGVVVYPTAQASSIAYELDGWYDADTNQEIFDLSSVAPSRIIAKFTRKAPNSESLFKVSESGAVSFDNNYIETLESVPSEIIFPEEVGGHTVTSLYANAMYTGSGVKTIILPETLTDMGSNCFSGWTSLENVYIPDTVTEIGAATFNSCSNLKYIEAGNIQKIGTSAFQMCSALTKFSSDTTTEIGTAAFNTCTSLTEAYFPELLKMGQATFAGCSNLETFYAPKCTQYDTSDFGGCDNLINKTIGEQA